MNHDEDKIINSIRDARPEAKADPRFKSALRSSLGAESPPAKVTGSYSSWAFGLRFAVAAFVVVLVIGVSREYWLPGASSGVISTTPELSPAADSLQRVEAGRGASGDDTMHFAPIIEVDIDTSGGLMFDSKALSAPAPEATRKDSTFVPEKDDTSFIQEHDNGKTYTFTQTSRFGTYFDIDKFPINDWTCEPKWVMGYVSNWSFNGPNQYPVGYEAVFEGECELRNGDFAVTIKVIALPN